MATSLLITSAMCASEQSSSARAASTAAMVDGRLGRAPTSATIFCVASLNSLLCRLVVCFTTRARASVPQVLVRHWLATGSVLSMAPLSPGLDRAMRAVRGCFSFVRRRKLAALMPVRGALATTASTGRSAITCRATSPPGTKAISQLSSHRPKASLRAWRLAWLSSTNRTETIRGPSFTGAQPDRGAVAATRPWSSTGRPALHLVFFFDRSRWLPKEGRLVAHAAREGLTDVGNLRPPCSGSPAKDWVMGRLAPAGCRAPRVVAASWIAVRGRGRGWRP
jgi:hypothetical protein